MSYYDPWSKEQWITFMERTICPDVNGRYCVNRCEKRHTDNKTCPLKLTKALGELYDAGYRNIKELEFQTNCKKKELLFAKCNKKEN